LVDHYLLSLPFTVLLSLYLPTHGFQNEIIYKNAVKPLAMWACSTKFYWGKTLFWL